MISVVLYRTDGALVGVKSEGHAGKRFSGLLGKLFLSNDHGNILCAAVSTLLYQLKVDLTMVEGLKPARSSEREGFFELTLAQPDAVKGAKYFKGFSIMLKQLELQYGNKIRIIMEDIHVT